MGCAQLYNVLPRVPSLFDSLSNDPHRFRSWLAIEKVLRESGLNFVFWYGDTVIASLVIAIRHEGQADRTSAIRQPFAMGINPTLPLGGIRRRLSKHQLANERFNKTLK